MANPDVSALLTSFAEQGGPIFSRNVLDWNLESEGLALRLNVNKPQALTKLSAVGGPRPYRSQDDTSGNGIAFSDRELIAYQSKWDMDFDWEEFRNTRLADLMKGGMAYELALNQISKEYLNALLLNTIGEGVRNGSGTGAVDVCDGFLTIIDAEVTATNLTEIVTGALSASDAVDKFETMLSNLPAWLRKRGCDIICSYESYDKYRKHYRTLNGFAFDPNKRDGVMMDNVNVSIIPASWMNNSGRLIATAPGNLVVGTDINAVQFYASQRRNIIECRPMFALGCQIQDLEAIFVNDQA